MVYKHRFLPVLLLLAAFAGCGENPAEPPPAEQGHAFVFTPPAGAPAITSISVRGSFNNWGETAMTRQANGAWRAVVDLAPDSYLYKFFINGAWITDMCQDTQWGHPNRELWVDPEADGCVPDGHGGQNAVVTVGTGGQPVFVHTPANPAHVSIAGGRLSVRFAVGQGQVQSASVVVGGQTFAMHHQLSHGLQDVWRASLPEGTTSYRFTLQTRSGTQEHGPFTVPAAPFRSVPWVGGSVGYQIFPERF
jgi:cyclomaltodextrinase / maltogenic alpha-amylase / neopullulanase